MRIQALLKGFLAMNKQKMQTTWECKQYWRVFSLWINRKCRQHENPSTIEGFSPCEWSDSADNMRMQALLKVFLSLNKQKMQTTWESKHYWRVFSLWINRKCRQHENASNIEGFSLYESTDNADNMRMQAVLKGFLSMTQQTMQNK
jgi:hypothetical protein